MPFILKRAARKKSRFYRNILDANETEQLRVAEKELKRMQVSGSNLEGTKPIRDENGTLISYQSPYRTQIFYHILPKFQVRFSSPNNFSK